jgi:hypothetical protein
VAVKATGGGARRRNGPLGIAAVEDKVVQQAVVTLLNAIYEEHFIGFPYVRNGPATGGAG